jgi:hypothetical protein
VDLQRFSLHRVPYVLQLHLKRFETQWGGQAAKISRHISFPMTLSLRDYMSKGEEENSRNSSGGGGGGGGGSGSSAVELELEYALYVSRSVEL